MVDYKHIAIAAVLKHPVHGIISCQPGIHDPIEDKIRVRDSKGNLFWVLASECEEPTDEEWKQYWFDFNKTIE